MAARAPTRYDPDAMIWRYRARELSSLGTIRENDTEDQRIEFDDEVGLTT